MSRVKTTSDNTKTMKVYLAGPLFSEADNAVLDRVEACVGSNVQFRFFSPRHGSGGNLRAVEGERREALAQRIYSDNIEQLNDCDIILLNIDNFDTGTIFEMGYASALRDTGQQKVVITYSPSAYGLNLMLNHSNVAGHFFSVDAVENFFQTCTAKNLSELKYDLRFASFNLKDNKDVERDVE
ncbi:putative nucleoside 2-deoxyribosyltransferase [Vibrio phage 150E35-1]|nr:putative nucleoside 2-deoxyribosyltransferase [Vibrio phage 150E35-1]